MAELHSIETLESDKPLVGDRAKYERQTIVFATIHNEWASQTEGVWIAPRQARIKAARLCAVSNLGPNALAYGIVEVSAGDPVPPANQVCIARNNVVAFGNLLAATSSEMTLGSKTVIEAGESLRFTTQIEAGAPGALGPCMVVLDFTWT